MRYVYQQLKKQISQKTRHHSITEFFASHTRKIQLWRHGSHIGDVSRSLCECRKLHGRLCSCQLTAVGVKSVRWRWASSVSRHCQWDWARQLFDQEHWWYRHYALITPHWQRRGILWRRRESSYDFIIQQWNILLW